ncbi:MAG TPA: tripartite tricarboxylate transporter substrate-binding protein [Burkholderiales bacterium]|nr:tripartite tricarboxylate transporter substrate-binding protein [Burkholderiales bacterium]
MNARRSIPLLASLALALALAAPARAQEPWPSRPLRFVVPSSPSGGTDLYARLLAQALAEPLAQPIVVENRPGGRGNIGAVAVAKAPPDGATFLVSGNPSLVINPALYPDLPYDAERDFAPVAHGVVNPLVLCVLPQVPARSVAELVALGRREPGALAFGSAGSTTATYFGVRLLQEASGARFIHVPYKGSGQAYQALLGAQVKFMMPDVGSALPHIRSGKLVPLAVTYPTKMLPGVPTMGDSGFPESDVNAVFSVVAPAATPRAIVERMNAAINAAMKAPWLAGKLEEASFIPVFETPQEFAASLKKDRAAWAAIVKRLGAKAE